MNRYLKDRLMKKDSMYDERMDDRNPYGSRGGYVRATRGRDSRMGDDYNYSEYDSRYDYRNNSNYRRQDYGRYPEQYGEHTRLYDYNMSYDYRMDYDHMEKEYHEELKKWIEKLKSKDRFRISKEQVLRQAKNMNVNFNDYNEEEFYATYLMVISDFPNVSNDYNVYLSMAKNWLEDKDAKKQGSDKLCAYLYEIVLDKEED